jgi:hypothetical protein
MAWFRRRKAPALSPATRSYLEGVLEYSGRPVAPQSREEIIEQLGRALNDAMIAALVRSLPFKNRQEYLSLEARGKSRKLLDEFLEANAPNPRATYTRVLATFREEYREEVRGDRNRGNVAGESGS